MIRRFWPLFITAFVVGGLFRLYQESGIGFYRMFGTLGIVVLGAMASRIIVTAQLGEGEREIKDVVRRLPEKCDVWRLTRRGADRVVLGPAGGVVLLASNVAQYARGWGLRRSLEKLRERMEQSVALVTRQLAAGALAAGGRTGSDGEGSETGHQGSADVVLHRAVVFLRRIPRPEEREWLRTSGIDTVDLDELYDYLLQRTVGAEAAAEEAGDGQASDGEAVEDLDSQEFASLR